MGACHHGGQPEQVLNLFAAMERMDLTPSVVAYNLALSACSSKQRANGISDWPLALEIIRSMRAKGTAPNDRSYALALRACARGQQCGAVLQLIDSMTADALGPSVYCMSVAMDACEKAGEWEQTLRLFRAVKTPNLISFTTAMKACGRGGQSDTVVELLDQMVALDVKPDLWCFNGAIAAVAIGPKPAEAAALFTRLLDSGIRPNVLTFGCVLCAYEKAGMHAEAFALLGEMRQNFRVKPTLQCYTSVMQAFCAAGDIKSGLALLSAVEREVSPVDLSKSYPLHRALQVGCEAIGDERKAARVQESMDKHKVVIRRPFAKARVSGESRTFVNDGNADAANVGKVATHLERRMAYTPQYHALPWGFRSKGKSLEQQRKSLMGRAEKRAFIALLAANCTAPNLEIAVNFKVCADCHSFLKAASTMIGAKSIVVREPRLTHTMQNGKCLCGDCWRFDEALRPSGVSDST